MSYSNIQHAIDTVCRQYDDLRSQGVKHIDALDFIRLEHGVERHKVAAIINDRDAGYHGASGETATAAVSTPQTAASPVGAVPDIFPEEWSE